MLEKSEFLLACKLGKQIITFLRTCWSSHELMEKELTKLSCISCFLGHWWILEQNYHLVWVHVRMAFLVFNINNSNRYATFCSSSNSATIFKLRFPYNQNYCFPECLLPNLPWISMPHATFMTIPVPALYCKDLCQHKSYQPRPKQRNLLSCHCWVTSFNIVWLI